MAKNVPQRRRQQLLQDGRLAVALAISILSGMVLFWLFLLAIGIQSVYALYFFVRIFRIQEASTVPGTRLKPLSVIICAKNEAENLRKNLPLILAQKYTDDNGKSRFEVLVADDASDDDTQAALHELKQRYRHLQVVVIPPGAGRVLQGKKHALSMAVAAASYEWLVLTDADCAPATDQWLDHMVAPLARGKEIVAGYGGYNFEDGLLNAFIRWETLHTFLQYSTCLLAGIPYMAVGRNMACTKQILEKAQRAPVWNLLPSGDDDLLVSLAGGSGNMALTANAASFTRSDAKHTWREWMAQKQRHLSTGKYYKPRIKLLLGVYGFSHAIIWALFIALFFSRFWEPALLLMSIRCAMYWTIWAVTGNKLGEKKLIYLYPLFDFGWLVYNFVFFPFIAWRNKTRWK